MDAIKEIQSFLSRADAPSGRELSAIIGRSSAYLSSVLKRRHTPPYDTAKLLAEQVFPGDSEKQQDFVLSFYASSRARKRKKVAA